MSNKRRISSSVIYSSLTVLFGYLAAGSPVSAAPQGGQIVGGSGNITQSNLTTNIKQNTQNLAIDWNSFNLNINEMLDCLLNTAKK
jgi:large exoprotein involved in heme utilization and adhesion